MAGLFDDKQLLSGAGRVAFNSETIELAKQALSGALGKTTGIDTTLGLVGYPLEAPSKKLYPVLSPIRNLLARIPVTKLAVGAMAGTALNWKQITAINSARVWGSVAQGVRNSQITYTEADKSAAFKTFGLDDNVVDEAIWAGRGFEDVKALSALATLQAVMIIEEYMLLGGNITALGAPATPTLDATQPAAGTGSLTASTAYSIKVSALTMQGWLQQAKGNGGSDALGETTPSSVLSRTTAASGAGSDAIAFSWAAKRGAVAYNIYAYTSAAVRYIATVFTNSYVLTALGASTNVANTADQTANALDYDGFIPQIENASTGGYYASLNNAALTSDGAQGIVEIDAALQSLWDNSRVGPQEIWVNSQEINNITKKLTNAGSSSLVRVMVNNDADAQGNLIGGTKVVKYINKYTNEVIDIRVHPYVPPGKVVGLTRRLPEWFPNNNVGEAAIVATLQEYADYEFARTARSYPHGVYASEVLVLYAPSFNFVLSNVKNG